MSCGRGSVGRASPCQGEGRGFESRRPLGGKTPRLPELSRARPRWWSGRVARQRPAKPYTWVRIPSPPRTRAIGAAVARFPDTEEVTGSIPVSPTSVGADQRLFRCDPRWPLRRPGGLHPDARRNRVFGTPRGRVVVAGGRCATAGRASVESSYPCTAPRGVASGMPAPDRPLPPRSRGVTPGANRPKIGGAGSTDLPDFGARDSPPVLHRAIRSARCMDLQRQTRQDYPWPRPCRPNRPVDGKRMPRESAPRVVGAWQGRLRSHTPTPPWKGSIMDKWRSVKNSTIIRVTTSVGTLVALAALAGAGWKWN